MIVDAVEIAQNVMGSPWLYLAIYVFVAIDGFFPTIPGETLVVTSGVFAASGQPELPLVVLVAAAGGLTGDHVSYGIGRLAGSRLLERMRPGARKRKPFDWAARTLRQRGGSVLIICRFVPGCRTAATLTTGSVRFPLPSFAGFSSIGGLCWASYFTMVGYLGGITFRQHPLLGVVLGIALAVLVAGAVEGIRNVRQRRAETGEDFPAEETAGQTSSIPTREGTGTYQ